MGKTKTALISDTPIAAKTSEEEYRAKKERQAAAAKAKAVGEKPEKVHIAGLKGGQRIKMVEVETPAEPAVVEAEEKKEGKKQKIERVRGKKYQEAKKKIKIGEDYSLTDAIKLVKDTSFSAFDGTFEAHLIVKKVGLSANLTLPHSFGKSKKVELATDETVKALGAGKIGFDVLLATSDMMPKLVPFAKLLGPRGLMPNPKNGTLIKDVKQAKDFSTDALIIKTEREAPLIHVSFGKVSQKDNELKENLETLLKALGGSKQIVKGYIKSTMSPAVRITV